MSDTQERLDEIADAIGQIKSAAETASVAEAPLRSHSAASTVALTALTAAKIAALTVVVAASALTAEAATLSAAKIAALTALTAVLVVAVAVAFPSLCASKVARAVLAAALKIAVTALVTRKARLVTQVSGFYVRTLRVQLKRRSLAPFPIV